MSSVPTWAVWSIIVPCVLLSPVIAFFLALAAEILVGTLVNAGAPVLALLGAGAGGLLLWRELREGPRRKG
jgi:hypothetical protein